ncbi:MAG: S-formylglutathione hydrolase [Deltaproteobacteria bacterium]|nr:S-formylglutathione hydrolase [Deltaproteobacteria bacterium]MBI3295866.1 S-formylglutathione hydrolase [Deltaproteobacteria bacterium]
MERPTLIKGYKAFGGTVEFYSFPSHSCGGALMRFSIFLPASAPGEKCPVLYWLSGLECTEETFMIKAGAQRVAAELGLILVAPDTSPRNVGIPGETETWTLGQGASFYVNATEALWAKHYRMDDFVGDELPRVIEEFFPVAADKRSISGHSMGGHGALTQALRKPGFYKSVSAFAPICAPSQCPWGENAFTAYLGADRTVWAQYDTNELVKGAKSKTPLFIDQGLGDKFLDAQLKPEILRKTCADYGYPLKLRLHQDYDHSYYFMSSFIEDHLKHHAQALGIR